MILLFTRKKHGMYCGPEAVDLKRELEYRGLEYTEVVNMGVKEGNYNAYSAALSEASWEDLDWNTFPWLARVENRPMKLGEAKVGRKVEDIL